MTRIKLIKRKNIGVIRDVNSTTLSHHNLQTMDGIKVTNAEYNTLTQY